KKLLAMVVLLLAATAAPASADSGWDHVVDYRVDVTATVNYHHQISDPDGSVELNSKYTIALTLPDVSFVNGKARESLPGKASVSGVLTDGHFESAGGGGDCVGHDAYETHGPPKVFEARADAIAGQVIVSPFDWIAFTWKCTGTKDPGGLALTNLRD